jgi:hypothetical protein
MLQMPCVRTALMASRGTRGKSPGKLPRRRRVGRTKPLEMLGLWIAKRLIPTCVPGVLPLVQAEQAERLSREQCWLLWRWRRFCRRLFWYQPPFAWAAFAGASAADLVEMGWRGGGGVPPSSARGARATLRPQGARPRTATLALGAASGQARAAGVRGQTAPAPQSPPAPRGGLQNARRPRRVNYRGEAGSRS